MAVITGAGERATVLECCLHTENTRSATAVKNCAFLKKTNNYN